MPLKTNEEKAQMYEDAIDALVGGGVQSYTLPTGQSVTQLNLESLERLASYYRKASKRSLHGIVTLMDHGRRE